MSHKDPVNKDKVEPTFSGGREVSYHVLGVDIVEFTTHADAQMKLRGIRENEVLKALKSPQETGLPTQIMRNRVR